MLLNTHSFSKLKINEKTEKEYRELQLKKLQKIILQDIALFNRRKNQHNERVAKYKILINYIKSYK